MLWSDESKFNLFSSDGIHYVRRPPGKKFDPKYQVPTVKYYGGGSVMVWGCFSGAGIGSLVQINGIMTAEKYKNIMRDHMLPYATENLEDDWIYQQDNDPKHTAILLMGSKKTKKKGWFKENGVEVLEWPAQSPDLNPIEHLSEQLDRRIRTRTFTKTGHQLMQVLSEEWNKLSDDFLNNFIESMSRRCHAVIALKGYATKY